MHDNDLLPAKQIAFRMLKLLLEGYSRRVNELFKKSCDRLLAPQRSTSMDGPAYSLSGLSRIIELQKERTMLNSSVWFPKLSRSSLRLLTSSYQHALLDRLDKQANVNMRKVQRLAEFAMTRADKKNKNKNQLSFVEFAERILPTLPKPAVYMTHTFFGRE